jgi:hypothetical protein
MEEILELHKKIERAPKGVLLYNKFKGMELMNSIEKLKKVQSEGFFTCGLPFEQFVSDLCKRYTRVYGEILPVGNYDYIVEKLEEKEII